MKTQLNYNLGLMVLAGLLTAACGDSRPDGSATTDGTISIQVTASVDGAMLADEGITGSQAIVVAGSTTDDFLVAEFSYSWNGGEFKSIEVSESSRDFQIDLILKDDKNTLVLRALDTTEISDTISVSLAYFRDVNPPEIEAPSDEFAATIFSEVDQELEITATTMELTGGSPLPVKDGVAFSKYSSRYGSEQPNRPVWRFNVSDNYSIPAGITLEYRVLRKETSEVWVDWTTADSGGDDADFEVTISSTLNPLLGETNGIFIIETRAVDSVGNSSDAVRQEWTQTVINPPIFIATGSEDIMGVAGGPRDPRSYQIGVNFSGLTQNSGLIVGSIRVGNPNSVPVLVNLTSLVLPLASYRYRRSWTLFEADPDNTIGPLDGCGVADTNISGPLCRPQPQAWDGRFSTVLRDRDKNNTELVFEVRNVGGAVVSTGSQFIIPPNTQYFAMATLGGGVGNGFSDPSFQLGQLQDGAIGPYWNNVTYYEIEKFLGCALPGSSGFVCNQWDVRMDLLTLQQFYATWGFTAGVESAVSLNEEDAVFREASLDPVEGYSRVLASGSNNNGGVFAAPTSHDGLSSAL